jgi:hypothetical protein
LPGSALLVLARGALGTLFAAAVAHIYSDAKIKALARNQTWRDIGAAFGPLVTGVGLSIMSPQIMHLLVALAFAAGLASFVFSPGWKLLVRQSV